MSERHKKVFEDKLKGNNPMDRDTIYGILKSMGFPVKKEELKTSELKIKWEKNKVKKVL